MVSHWTIKPEAVQDSQVLTVFINLPLKVLLLLTLRSGFMQSHRAGKPPWHRGHEHHAQHDVGSSTTSACVLPTGRGQSSTYHCTVLQSHTRLSSHMKKNEIWRDSWTPNCDENYCHKCDIHSHIWVAWGLFRPVVEKKVMQERNQVEPSADKTAVLPGVFVSLPWLWIACGLQRSSDGKDKFGHCTFILFSAFQIEFNVEIDRSDVWGFVFFSEIKLPVWW